MIEQLPYDAEFRTFGEAVTLSGTVQVALNDAERCTWLKKTGVDVADVLWATSGGADFGGGGRLMEEAVDDEDEGGGCGGWIGGLDAAENFFGDGVDELILC